jgi:hypothetical protein
MRCLHIKILLALLLTENGYRLILYFAFLQKTFNKGWYAPFKLIKFALKLPTIPIGNFR